MKFKINQQDFAWALATCSRSLPSKVNLPILSSVLVEASKDEVEIISTNLESATKVRVSCKVDVEGKVAVFGKQLIEFVPQLPEGEVLFEKLGEEVVISMGDYSGRFASMPFEEFPSIPTISKGRELVIEASGFVRYVPMVTFSAAQDEGRPVLTGVLGEVKKDKLCLVATDGYRLSYQAIPVRGKAEGLRFVVPSRTLVEVVRIVADGLEKMKDKSILIKVADSLNQIDFKIDDVEFTSRLIEGEFPNWEKIIPASFTTKVRVFKDDFVRLIKIASIFARDSGNIVRLTLDVKGDGGKGKDEGKPQGILVVSANAAQVGSNESRVLVDLEGKGGEIAFNFRYLLEALSVLEGESVNFEMIESLNPGRLTGEGEMKDFFHIIMPVRLQS